ncbi:uncharacterized protein [Miscanthus floridulus]|uniref:uncharacterized protein n=1 Tax=Miscanthus floridulus TaxID=154761 RepID=UPI0034587416
MGRALLLLAALLGPVATFAAVVAESTGRWLPATGVSGARDLAVAAIARRGSCNAASTSAPTALPADVGAGAATGVLLLTACLASGFPVFLAEHQTPHGVHDLLRLGALLEHTQPSDHLLDGDLVQIKEHLEGDSSLVQPFRDHLQQLLHYLGVGDVVAEGAEVGGERGDADAELIDALPFLEGEVSELPAKLLRAGVARAFVADPQVLDCVPRLFHRALDGEGAPELGGHRAQKPGHRLSVVVVLIFVGVLGDAMVDDVPDSKGLEVHLHDQGPFRIVCPGQHRPRDVRRWSLNDALDDARPGIPVARVAAVRAATATWRRFQRLDFLLAGGVTSQQLLGW